MFAFCNHHHSTEWNTCVYKSAANELDALPRCGFAWLKRRGRRHATISLWPFGKVRRTAGCSISFVSFCNVHFKQPHFSNSASPVGLSHSYYQDVLRVMTKWPFAAANYRCCCRLSGWGNYKNHFSLCHYMFTSMGALWIALCAQRYQTTTLTLWPMLWVVEIKAPTRIFRA
jgi:hypothetical protein